MDNQGNFRIATFGGFNKNDVWEYINIMSKRAKVTEHELNMQIKELTAEKEELLERLKAYENNMGQPQPQVSTLEGEVAGALPLASEMERYQSIVQEDKEKLMQYEDMLRARQNELDQYHGMLQERDDKIAAMQMKMEAYEQERAEHQNTVRDLTEKCRSYDNLTSEVGGVLVSAQSYAETIVAQARERAVQVRQESVDERNRLLAEMQAIGVDVAEVQDKTKNIFAGIDDRMQALVAEIQGLRRHEPIE